MRGGKREGAGRPVGTKKENTRKMRCLRATDEEWKIIKDFEKKLKKGIIEISSVE